jgi:hypothetical protein
MYRHGIPQIEKLARTVPTNQTVLFYCSQNQRR